MVAVFRRVSCGVAAVVQMGRYRRHVSSCRWLTLLVAVTLPHAVAAQSEPHALHFDLLKLENGAAIPQSFGDVPEKLDVRYRVLDQTGRRAKAAVSFAERSFRYSSDVLFHRWATASGQDLIAEIALVPQTGYQVTLRCLRIATQIGSNPGQPRSTDVRIRLADIRGDELDDRVVEVGDRSPAVLSPAVTSTKGLRFQWETRDGTVGLAAVSVLLTPIGQQPFEPFVNSLGLTFEKVPGSEALIATTEVRVKDYAAFAEEQPEANGSWKNFVWEEWSKVFQTWRIPSQNPDRGDINAGPLVEDVKAEQSPEEPVVNVSWEDANAFCRWLSKKEGRNYRLLTDAEWSCAAGIAATEDSALSPSEKSSYVRQWVWGTHFPPADNSENLGAVGHFKDEYPHTAPVTATAPNLFGLYGLAGNVQEWCEDSLADGSFFKVVRGGGWRMREFDSASARRFGLPAFQRSLSVGFRIALDAPDKP